MVPSKPMRPIVITATTELGTSPEEVWRFVSDTDRTNRVLGARPVAYTPIEEGASTSARFVATTSAGLFTLTYEELPFEWHHARDLRVVRKMRGGLLESYSFAWSLRPSAVAVGGTRVEITLELLPRYNVLRPAIWLEGRTTMGRLLAFAASIDAHVRSGAPSPFAQPRSPVDEALLGDGVAALGQQGIPADLCRRLGGFLRDASDADLVRIRPFELADAWKEDRRAVLRAMLHGVPAGLFELRWAIVCPSCRTASEMAASLEEVKAEGHCQMCDIRFELDLDRAVEATFVPHGAVRRVEPRLFCIAGPSRTPHVLVQANLAATEARTFAAPSDPGRYRVFARGGASGSIEVEAGAPAEAEVAIGESGVLPVEIHVAPGGTIAIANATDQGRHVKLERLAYANDAATAHHVSTVEEFRRLFSRDILKRGTPLKVARVTILFSDLTGSTALYSKLGDAAAFRFVDDHFDVLRQALSRHDGVVVKTMGDAVMAAFSDPRACLNAAIDVLREFDEFRRTTDHGPLVGLKLGAVAGPCYVVTANSALDYFGQTVNVASRVQHLAGAGELVVPYDLYVAAGEERRRQLRMTERFEAKVKGVDAPLDLVRLTLPVATPRQERPVEDRVEVRGP